MRPFAAMWMSIAALACSKPPAPTAAGTDAPAFTPSTCPKGTRWNGLTCDREEEERAPRKRTPAKVRPTFDFDLARDARPLRRTTRAPAEIDREIVTSLSRRPSDDWDVAARFHRIATLGEELAFALERDADAGIEKPEGVRSLIDAEGLALDGYEQLTTTYRDWCARAPQGCFDESLFHLGMLRERRGEVEKARKAYFGVVSSHPPSTYAPHAYLSFALLFRAEAGASPERWELVRQSATEARRRETPALAEAIARVLADAYRGMGDPRQAAEEAALADQLAKRK